MEFWSQAFENFRFQTRRLESVPPFSSPASDIPPEWGGVKADGGRGYGEKSESRTERGWERDGLFPSQTVHVIDHIHDMLVLTL